MRTFLVCLTLVIVLFNAVSVVQADADVVNEQHHIGTVLPNEQAPEHDHGPLAHHCCHTHAHVFLLTEIQPHQARIDNAPWFIVAAPSPLPIGFAPPVPPPRA